MKTISLSSLGLLSRNRLVAACLFLFVVGAAYVVAGYIIADDLKGLALVGIVVVGVTIVVAIFNNWRNGLYFFLTWLLFEDLARKFLGNNMAIYFAKDALLLIVYLSFFIALRRKSKDLKSFRPPFLGALLLLVWFGVLEVFNPASTTIFFGLLGLKLYFYYVPLLFVGYAMIDNKANAQLTWTGAPPNQQQGGNNPGNTPLFGSKVSTYFVTMTHRF